MDYLINKQFNISELYKRQLSYSHSMKNEYHVFMNDTAILLAKKSNDSMFDYNIEMATARYNAQPTQMKIPFKEDVNLYYMQGCKTGKNNTFTFKECLNGFD